MSESNLTCSFCGEGRDDVDKLIAGPNVYICDQCVTLSYDIVIGEKTKMAEAAEEYDHLPSPPEIKEHLDDWIISHDRVKQLLSVSSYNHYKRIQHNENNDMEFPSG